jgi:hypothetical protein
MNHVVDVARQSGVQPADLLLEPLDAAEYFGERFLIGETLDAFHEIDDLASRFSEAVREVKPSGMGCPSRRAPRWRSFAATPKGPAWRAQKREAAGERHSRESDNERSEPLSR